jgi:hypothetical protein
MKERERERERSISHFLDMEVLENIIGLGVFLFEERKYIDWIDRIWILLPVANISWSEN